MESPYNPWIKPRAYKPATNIEATNAKLKKDDVEKTKRINALKEVINNQNQEPWDALQEA